ncbi:hypothetical protein AKJ16_DCAP26514 [Drosera capensis]
MLPLYGSLATAALAGNIGRVWYLPPCGYPLFSIWIIRKHSRGGVSVVAVQSYAAIALLPWEGSAATPYWRGLLFILWNLSIQDEYDQVHSTMDDLGGSNGGQPVGLRSGNGEQNACQGPRMAIHSRGEKIVFVFSLAGI